MGLPRIAVCACALMSLALGSRAAAQPVVDLANERIEGEVEQPDGALPREAPDGTRNYDEAVAARRLEQLARAIAAAREPIARAALRLDRATLHAARARHEWIAMLTAQLRRDEAKDPAAKQAHDPEIARRGAALAQARTTAIAELTELVCDPADRARGLACRAPAALRRWPALDEALHQLAYLLDAERRADDAARVYRRLADDHPGSRHRGAALVALADRAFERADLAAAKPLYRAAQAAPPAQAAPAVRAYAAYKLGWVHYNFGRSQDAFASFAGALALAATDPKSTALAREARRDLARAFAGYGAPAGAFAAFEAVAPGHGLDLLARLGGVWLDVARSADATAVFRELLRRAPNDARRCDWQLGLAQAARLAFASADLAREATELATSIGPSRAQPAASRCIAEARRFLDDAAREAQRSAAQTRTAPAAELAESLAAAAARAFTAEPEQPRLLLLRADAAHLLAETSAAARPAPSRSALAHLWRLTADRYDEAAKHPALPRSDRSRALTARDQARDHAARSSR